jgi:hypothetical protein
LKWLQDLPEDEYAKLTSLANEGLNPRIHCGESIPSFSEKELDTKGVI